METGTISGGPFAYLVLDAGETQRAGAETSGALRAVCLCLSVAFACGLSSMVTSAYSGEFSFLLLCRKLPQT